MLVDIQVPVQGLTVTEATLVRWAKAIGEPVAVGEMLFEIETDKAAQEIESPATGTVLSQTAQVGDVVKLGAVIGVIGTGGGDTAPEIVGVGDPVVCGRSDGADGADGSSGGGQSTGDGFQVSPRARRAAERLGVDLSAVRPSGGHGRHVRERDVIAAASARPARAAAPVRPASSSPASRIRRVTAERTAASFRDTPHFYLSREVCAARLLALREDLVSDASACGGVRITITDLLVKALALAVGDCPGLNAQWADGSVVALTSVDVCLAMDTPDGLVVPVIRDADRLAICRLAQERKALTDRVRAGRFTADDVSGGSFTLTNLGQLDVDEFHAVINPPQSGILAAGTIKPRPFVVDGQLVVKPTVVLTLSVDHRVVDGADAARFLQRIVHYIEHPGLLLLEQAA